MYDGQSADAPLLYRISGNTLPVNFATSTQQYMFVRFYADDYVSGNGVIASFSTGIKRDGEAGGGMIETKR